MVIINAKELVVTGNKRLQKSYFRHSGYPGGLRERRLEEQLTRNPAKVIEHSVRGMLPVNKLRAGRLARLKIYVEDQHEHQAQKPTEYKLDKAGK